MIKREIVGASLTGVTFIGTTTELVARSLGRVTVIVRLLVPVWFTAGYTVSVAVLPARLTTMFVPVGNSVGFDDEKLNVKSFGFVTMSPKSNVIVPD